MTNSKQSQSVEDEWITLECERAHYVDYGRNVILCDRLPSPVTLVVKLRSRSPLEDNSNG